MHNIIHSLCISVAKRILNILKCVFHFISQFFDTIMISTTLTKCIKILSSIYGYIATLGKMVPPGHGLAGIKFLNGL